MASDALLTEWAQSFVSRLTPVNRVLWDRLLDEFIAEPINDSTVPFPESGVDDARATLVGPFAIIWRYINPEIIAVATVRWGPDSPASDPKPEIAALAADRLALTERPY